MPISRRADYAMRLMLEIAWRDSGSLVPVKTLAYDAAVPYEFARVICTRLSLAGLLATKRGANGGVRLARPARQISLMDIIDSVDGTICMPRCTRPSSACDSCDSCALRRVWTGISDHVKRRLETVTLADAAMGSDRER